MPAASATAWSELWGLHDVLTHTSFWLAQISISTVHAVVSAFLFHRKDLMEDVRIDPNQSLTLEVMVALACAVCAPAGLLIGRKEYMVIVALLVTGAVFIEAGDFDDHADGRYTVRYHATVSGDYEVDVRCNTQPIKGSPFTLRVEPSAVHGPSCTAAGDGLRAA